MQALSDSFCTGTSTASHPIVSRSPSLSLSLRPRGWPINHGALVTGTACLAEVFRRKTTNTFPTTTGPRASRMVAPGLTGTSDLRPRSLSMWTTISRSSSLRVHWLSRDMFGAVVTPMFLREIRPPPGACGMTVKKCYDWAKDNRWHYLSSAACLTWPHLSYALFVESRAITNCCYIIRRC